jgi:Tfp pilus assembly protein PilX
LNKGFALVVTLSLMILLTVIAVGLLSLSAVSFRSSSQELAQAEARANARMALMLAVGELQKAMGPDQRISARAETLARHPDVAASVPPNTGKAWWVGVSHSNPQQTMGSAVQPVVWLVSGLKHADSSKDQISQSLAKPVPMYGEKSIDTAVFTGGQPIEAGIVMTTRQGGQISGGFAYFIDDNGMKAQLAAVNPQVRNDRDNPHGGGVLPGTYGLGILDQMKSLEQTPWEDYNRLVTINDLPLLGADRTMIRSKRLGYTTRSQGVLSDVRKGGLKRDLTIAFENDTVFTNVFPNTPRGGGFDKRFLVVDGEKIDQASDLLQNGYIHWAMFKDYYNIKKHILRKGTNQYLDSIMITKNGIFNGWNDTPFGRGQLGPHQIGPNADVPGEQQRMPYGDYSPIAPPSKTSFYKHSPLVPILARMQQNAWVEKKPSAGRGQPEKLRTNVQLWVAQYNPYNIGLNVVGDGTAFGPRIIHYPQVKFTLDGVTVRNSAGATLSLNNVPGFSGKRQTSIPHEVLLGPGRSHVSAFKGYGTVGRDDDDFLFDDSVRNLTLESIYTEYDLVSSAKAATLTVDFVLERPSMMHGSNANSYNANHEVAQTMWAPFAWDAIGGNLPGKRIIKRNISPNELNENTMASFAFQLRTTREGGGAIRPLVDSNIRALMCNTKWDSPLGVDLLAAYSPENRGETNEPIFQMNTVDSPKGYTYWGGGLDPVDGYDRVILFDIPREDLVSLGQLQHASVGRFSYEPTYVVGNSYANLRIPLDRWRASVNDTFSTPARGLGGLAIPGRFNLYDASYLVNEELWDGYIFTTIPQVRDNYGATGSDPNPTTGYFQDLLAGKALLPNPRFIPYEPRGSKFDKATLQMTSGSRGTTGGFYHNAGHLLVDGAFNVNSTSVDAWEAFLSGTHKLPWQKLTGAGTVTGFTRPGDVAGVRFPRVKSVLGGPMETDSLNENYWTGFRSLKPEEVRELAKAIVEEIRKRGPFLSMGEFVNRKLQAGDLGQRGALQAALDSTVNKNLDDSFEKAAGHSGVPKDSTQGAAYPGQLLQGDILQSLSPFMTVRSDTFTIRAYGESLAPGTNKVSARAWCEATLQRFPDPVGHSAANSDARVELANPGSRFGRSFRIMSFRWLSAAEI